MKCKNLGTMEEELEAVKEKVLGTLVETSYFGRDRPHEKSAVVKLTHQTDQLFFALLDIQR